MYQLYSNYSPGEDIIAAREKHYISPDAILVLSAMTQIVIDIADAFNEKFLTFNFTAIAPSYPYIMYRAGMQILMSGDFPDEKAERNFHSVRKCCWYFSHRWLIAGWSTLNMAFKSLASIVNFSLSCLSGNSRGGCDRLGI